VSGKRNVSHLILLAELRAIWNTLTWQLVLMICGCLPEINCTHFPVSIMVSTQLTSTINGEFALGLLKAMPTMSSFVIIIE
jgi:hypothetical protein